jgi:two-component sensor histidine kinase
MGDPYRIKEAYHVRFKLDTAEGNFKAGIRDLVMYQQINDSMLNETKSRQIKQLEVLYDKQQQQDEIKLKDQNISLLNQTNEVQQLHLRQAVRLRNETLAGSALLLIVGGLFYRQYRQKLKTNRIISHQNADISKKNELLEHLLKEKEWLLKEVHHRVKNNLHTVICLLESQAASLESDALKAFENSQHRIYAMSLIHQKLYQSEDIKTIDMSLYLPEFIQYLKDSFDTPRRIVFFFDIEPIKLGVSQAIPIALIINEAVTNAIKYAFNGRSNGRIEIRMHRKADQITLTISDNGVGIDPLVLMAPSESLGLKLMNGLSEDINGDIRIITDDGTTIKICFAIDLLANAYHPLSQAAIQD